MRSTQIFTALALLAASASSLSIAPPAANLAHRRHASEVTHNAVLQARAARMRNMSGMAEAAELAAAKRDIPRTVRKRGVNARRCAAKSSSSALPSSTVAPAVNVGAEPTTSSESQPTTSVKTTSSAKARSTAEPTTTKSKAASKTSSTAKETATGGSSSSGSDTFTGQATFYGTGLGACGITNKDTDYIAAVSMLLFDGFEGYTGGNPNSNPICGRKAKATYKGKSVTVTVTDRCVGCAMYDLDFAPSAFDQLADQALGRLSGMTWSWA